MTAPLRQREFLVTTVWGRGTSAITTSPPLVKVLGRGAQAFRSSQLAHRSPLLRGAVRGHPTSTSAITTFTKTLLGQTSLGITDHFLNASRETGFLSKEMCSPTMWDSLRLCFSPPGGLRQEVMQAGHSALTSPFATTSSRISQIGWRSSATLQLAETVRMAAGLCL